MAQIDRRGFNSRCNINVFLFSTLVNEYWTLHDFTPKRNFVMNILLYCLRKSCGGGEYDVMIIDAVQTYFLFGGGNIIPCQPGLNLHCSMACDDRPVCISTFYLQIRGAEYSYCSLV